MKSAVYSSPLGDILLAAGKDALTGLWFIGQRYEGRSLPEGCPRVQAADDPILQSASEWLDEYFSGKVPELCFALRPEGTAFQRRVWEALLHIPYGETVSYGEIAGQIGCASARAVGGAVGKNPISLIVPCHRVLGADGSLTGYAGGTDRKKKLLEWERRNRE